MLSKYKKRLKRGVLVFFLLMAIFFSGFFFFPQPLFKADYSSVLYAEDGTLLSAFIAKDEQWRFPPLSEVPYKLEKSILSFEDAYFYNHFGINPVALVKAFKHNLSKPNRRGASTISMQLMRMVYGNPKRSYLQKIKEMYFSVLLELKYSKAEILNMYLSHAPMGGNIVGVNSASWRYFNRGVDQLSWAEAALLAVLPNAPGLLYPGKRSDKLKQKRDFLLKKMMEEKILSEATYELAIQEKIPKSPLNIDQNAFHFLTFMEKEFVEGKQFYSTIDHTIQQMVLRKAKGFSERYAQNKVNNIAVMVMDIESMEVKAYAGNVTQDHQQFVDIIQAKRSSGSTLKPFLYGMVLTEGSKIPTSLLYDVPLSFNGFRPQNYSKNFKGLVTFQDALSQSLNIPAVTLLRDYGVERFKHNLNTLGYSYINQTASHYGLSLILGGAELSLFDLTTTYALMGKSVLNNQKEKIQVQLSKRYQLDKFYQLPNAMSVYNTYQILEILSNVNRPRNEDGWKFFTGSKKIAWKTGTSFGHRDAWAVGIDGKYAVGVWVGNASGEGRNGLTGTTYAGPILFSVFNNLGHSNWFKTPTTQLYPFDICKITGYLANENSPEVEQQFHEKNTSGLPQQNFYKKYWITMDGQYRAFKNCFSGDLKLSQAQLNIPPLALYYYQKSNLNHSTLPPLHPNCKRSEATLEMQYPLHNSSITLPVNVEGEQEPLLMEAHAKQPNTTIHWHLNNRYLGSTQNNHQMSVFPKQNSNQLILVDEEGNQLTTKFYVNY